MTLLWIEGHRRWYRSRRKQQLRLVPVIEACQGGEGGGERGENRGGMVGGGVREGEGRRLRESMGGREKGVSSGFILFS